MKFKLGRRAAAVAAVTALAAGAVGMATGSASAASAPRSIYLNIRTAGLYSQPYSWSAKVGPDLLPDNTIVVDCWTVGETIGNQGDVWYHTIQERYDSYTAYTTGWTYGAYVDGYYAFHNGLPHC